MNGRDYAQYLCDKIGELVDSFPNAYDYFYDNSIAWEKWLQCGLAYLCAGDNVADVYCEYVSNDDKGVKDRADFLIIAHETNENGCLGELKCGRQSAGFPEMIYGFYADIVKLDKYDSYYKTCILVTKDINEELYNKMKNEVAECGWVIENLAIEGSDMAVIIAYKDE